MYVIIKGWETSQTNTFMYGGMWLLHGMTSVAMRHFGLILQYFAFTFVNILVYGSGS